MKGFQPTRYDDVPYLAAAHSFTHPEVLATTAMLRGLDPPPLEGGRVLELGCARGANLIPMALLLPRTTFVGVDRSELQIDEGRRRALAAGLTNLEFRTVDLLAVDSSLGLFDYVIAHGVFSWVEHEVQEKVLEIASRNLSPSGIAYVSYNTFPGWHVSTMFRDMMLYHVRDVGDPATRAAKARAFIQFLAESARPKESLWALLLKGESAYIGDMPDWYLLHDDLEDENHPVYFFQIVERAAAHGLQYLAEERELQSSEIFPERVWRTIDGYGLDRIGREQHADFLRNTRFRRSLFCHAGLPLAGAPALDSLRRCRYRTHVRQGAPLEDPDSPGASVFVLEDGRKVKTNDPRLVAVLGALCSAWPRALAFGDLEAAVGAAIGDQRTEGMPDVAALTTQALFQAMMAQLVSLHLTDPPIAASPGERPLATPYARLQAAAGENATNLLLRDVELSLLDRLVLARLDGQTDRAGLASQILPLLEPEIPASPDAARLGAAEVIEPPQRPLPEQIEETLRKLAAECCLLA